MSGNPRCPDCNGRGGRLSHGRWFACACVKPRKGVLRIQRAANEQPGRPFKTVADMIRERNERK